MSGENENTQNIAQKEITGLKKNSIQTEEAQYYVSNKRYVYSITMSKC